MKRLISAILAPSLLGASSASAQPYHRGGFVYRGGWHGHRDGAALIGLGVSLFALGAIAVSQHDQAYDHYQYGPPPPPPTPPTHGGYGYGY